MWWHDQHDLQLDLCAVHSDQHADALVGDGWALIIDERVDAIQPAPLPALTADPATH
jgi:hypothetical protein